MLSVQRLFITGVYFRNTVWNPQRSSALRYFQAYDKSLTENIGRKHSKRQRGTETDIDKTWKLKRSGGDEILNEINKEGTFTKGLKDWRKIKRKDASNLTGKASAEKAWILYQFSFRLNPGDKPNDANTWKNYSSLYTENQFQANSEKKMMGHFRGSKIKPTKQLVASQKNWKYEHFVWGTQQQNLRSLYLNLM